LETKEFDFQKNFRTILQYPGKHGQVYDYADFIKKAADNEIKVAVAADILSLVKLLGEIGAAVVVGTTQRFGIPMGYGGPRRLFCYKGRV
jgi:glycine dehydrogenase